MSTATIVHEYVPRGSAVDLLESQHSEVLLSGPAGTGKSRACLEKLHLLALCNPGMRGLIVRKTQTSLADSALKTWERFVVVEALQTGLVEYFGGSAREPAQYRYSNGSAIVIGGMDKASKIMSTEYDVVYVQEAIELTENDWESITTRLRNYVISFQQIIADTNPSTPTHWLRQRASTGRTLMLPSHHEDNPMLFDALGQITAKGTDYLKKLDALTGVRKQRLRYGRWVAAEGAIYEQWDPSIHVVDRFDIPREWPRYWVVDFGFTNPFVLQRWAQDPDGRLYMYAETYRTKRRVEQHAKDILSRVLDDKGNWLEPRPVRIITDHDAESRSVLQQELGLPTVAADKRVKVGLEAVQKRLVVQGDGKARLYLLRDALEHAPDVELLDQKKPTCTEQEFPGYVWLVTQDKKKEEPLKEDDHGMDTTRYLVADRDLRPTARADRWL